METLHLIDIVLPPLSDVVCTEQRPVARRSFFLLQGPAVGQLRLMLELEARAKGYHRERHPKLDVFVRGEQRIELHDMGPERLGIRVDDAASLPAAQVFAGGIALAGLRLDLPPGASVVAGRERHDAGSDTWTAEWRIYHASAEPLATALHEQLCAGGLRPGGVWKPPAAAIPRWKIEASSAQLLVQVEIQPQEDYLVVRIDVVGRPDTFGGTHP